MLVDSMMGPFLCLKRRLAIVLLLLNFKASADTVARSDILGYHNAICKSKPRDLCRGGVQVEYLEFRPSGNRRLTFLHPASLVFPLPDL